MMSGGGCGHLTPDVLLLGGCWLLASLGAGQGVREDHPDPIRASIYIDASYIIIATSYIFPRKAPLAAAPSRPPMAGALRTARTRPYDQADQASLPLRHCAAPRLAAEESFSWFHHFGPSPALLLCLRLPPGWPHYLDDPIFY